MEYKKIDDNLYTNKKHRFVIKTCSYCSENFYCRKDKINTKNTCNRDCHQNLIEKNNIYIINDYTNDVIIGSLLSDGCITRSKKGKNYLWSHGCIHEDYIDFISSSTGLDMHKFKIYSKKLKKSSLMKSHFIIKDFFIIKSKISITFTKYRNEWYPEGKKIVPNTIKLTPTVLLHWYIGDGNLNNSNGILLCTDSFDFNSIHFLINCLEELNFNPIYNERLNRIIIPNRRVREFINYIGNCPVNSFKYKWNTFINESYINRECTNCGNNFDAMQNHQKYCKPKCAIEFSRKNNYNLKKLK